MLAALPNGGKKHLNVEKKQKTKENLLGSVLRKLFTLRARVYWSSS